MCLSLCACGTDGDEKAEEPKATSNSVFSVDGIYVDDSYRDDDGSSRRLVYLLYTVTAAEENLSLTSDSVKMVINGTNSYDGEITVSSDMAKYMRNYECSTNVKDIYVGESMKFVIMFLIPEADLADGRTVTFAISSSNYNIKGIEDVSLTTDDIKHFDNGDELAKAADPEGYAAAAEAREPVDEETSAAVKNLMNGRYWTWTSFFGKLGVTYRLEFTDGDVFTLSTSLGPSNGGTYTVLKEYIRCTYDSNGATVEIPYEIVNGEMKLYASDAFDYSENN